jgi:hypothetical protein
MMIWPSSNCSYVMLEQVLVVNCKTLPKHLNTQVLGPVTAKFTSALIS